MLKSLATVTAVLTFATLTHADVIVYDNTNASFAWVANGFAGANNSLFDPTLPPQGQQSEIFTPRSSVIQLYLGGSSTFIGADAISGGSAITFARNIAPVTVQPPSGGQPTEFTPATVFPAGSQVSASANFADTVDTAYFNPSLGRNPLLGQTAFIGFRVRASATAFHYGWIELDYRLGQTAGGVTLMFYQPVRWAYETLPNTPITVPATPAAVLLAAGGTATLRRSRRGS